METPYGQSNVPDWFDKLQAVAQSQESEPELSDEQQQVTREEWMILSDLYTPFTNSEQTSDSGHDWHLDRANYSEQQINEMPTWIKKNKEVFALDETCDVVVVNSFSEKRKIAYRIIKSHFDDLSNVKEPLCYVLQALVKVTLSMLLEIF